jgi:four helix bundle protein
MAKANQFEDLIVWQRARALAKEVYGLTSETTFQNDYGLRSQMQRAGVSIISNKAEGFERGSRREFHQFLTIAKGSCGELRAQLYVSLDVGYINQTQFDRTLANTQAVSKLLAALMSSLDANKKRKPPSG